MSIATIQWLLLLSIIGVTLWQCIYRLSDMPIVCQERQNIMHLLIFRTATKSKSNFNLKCIWLHFEMNISKCLKNCVLLDPMHSPLNGGTCFAEESAIPETPRILFLKFHRNKENPSHSKVSDKFCKHLVIIYDLYERWHVWLSWHCHVESKSKSFCI